MVTKGEDTLLTEDIIGIWQEDVMEMAIRTSSSSAYPPPNVGNQHGNFSFVLSSNLKGSVLALPKPLS